MQIIIFKKGILNYYYIPGSTIVNITYDDVTVNNYNLVNDIDCFSVPSPIYSVIELEYWVNQHYTHLGGN